MDYNIFYGNLQNMCYTLHNIISRVNMVPFGFDPKIIEPNHEQIIFLILQPNDLFIHSFLRNGTKLESNHSVLVWFDYILVSFLKFSDLKCIYKLVIYT